MATDAPAFTLLRCEKGKLSECKFVSHADLSFWIV
jgi:hypothetical protein